MSRYDRRKPLTQKELEEAILHLSDISEDDLESSDDENCDPNENVLSVTVTGTADEEKDKTSLEDLDEIDKENIPIIFLSDTNKNLANADEYAIPSQSNEVEVADAGLILLQEDIIPITPTPTLTDTNTYEKESTSKKRKQKVLKERNEETHKRKRKSKSTLSEEVLY